MFNHEIRVPKSWYRGLLKALNAARNTISLDPKWDEEDVRNKVAARRKQATLINSAHLDIAFRRQVLVTNIDEAVSVLRSFYHRDYQHMKSEELLAFAQAAIKEVLIFPTDDPALLWVDVANFVDAIEEIADANSKIARAANRHTAKIIAREAQERVRITDRMLCSSPL
jgi:hypothetical protein